MGSSSNPAHKAGVPRTGLVWGINRGHPTTRRVLAPRPVSKKAVASERVKAVRSVIREVAGFAPYERRAMELIRNSKDKRARKFIKRRIGTIGRAKRYVLSSTGRANLYSKMEILTGVIAEQRRAGH
ncbi:ribosomal protein L36 [Malassezia equina]|uniref:60S ribosomal protein L36 n=1 Tax=Malassezia equina TaxID=1381935 RepID=A0AAF0EDR9_9BASI|nr:ribosomal protein L36 [Malassezia equina]